MRARVAISNICRRCSYRVTTGANPQNKITPHPTHGPWLMPFPPPPPLPLRTLTVKSLVLPPYGA